jgi:hypothetical protein
MRASTGPYWNSEIPKEGTVNVQITIQINGQEVNRLETDVTGNLAEREEQAHRLGQQAACAVAEQALEEGAGQMRHPRCCGRSMNNRGRPGVTVQGLDGAMRIHRSRYRCDLCGCEVYPADGELMCGRHLVTRPLAKRACQLATVEHFTELPQLLFDQHGVRLSHEQLIELVHDVGGAAETLRRAEAQHWMETPAKRRVWPQAEVQPKRIYVSCDGIMYCTNQREPDPLHPGENRLIWQQMRVGCVYWQDEKGDWHKRVLWGRESPEEFGASLYRLACRCGYRQAEEKVFAADGGDWCWSISNRYFADAAGILDWYHASEHVWDCAKALHPQETAAQAWADQALALMRDEGGWGLLRWLLTLRETLQGEELTSLDSLINYVQPRQDRMDYPTYRRHDWQIGTGMIESTAKQLVAQRLKGAGMQWSEWGALAMTALRAQSLNRHWHRFWETLVLNC